MPDEQQPGLTYASAGVSIDAGNALVETIKSAVRSTRRPGADAEIGGFGGAFNLRQAGYTDLPTLIASIDGVGTKLKVAHAMGKHDTVGIDLVAMSVNDLIVQGATPLFFLDCFSCSKLAPETAASFIGGVAAGCRESNCALIGGETAEMPGMYTGEDYDAVGTAVGAIPSSSAVLPATARLQTGDVLLGLTSDGLHSNGFSLVRAVLDRAGLAYTDAAPWSSDQSVGDALLTPTRIYVRSVLAAMRDGHVKAAAHITGGGLPENVPRMLPKHLAAEIDVATWQVPEVFRWLKRAGGLAREELMRALNMGIGMVLVVAQQDVDTVRAVLEGQGETIRQIGRLVDRAEGDGQAGVLFKGWEAWKDFLGEEGK
ncbi:MAG: hypothetical protein M1825_003803 [Sarcosagium campestre]|nr:MAG: hypothetical protein M1825_003803 [Sarcosagium campestre]